MVQNRLSAHDKFVPPPVEGMKACVEGTALHDSPATRQDCAEGEAPYTSHRTRSQAPVPPWISTQVACRIEASVGDRLAEDRDTLSYTLFERSVGHLSEECA